MHKAFSIWLVAIWLCSVAGQGVVNGGGGSPGLPPESNQNPEAKDKKVEWGGSAHEEKGGQKRTSGLESKKTKEEETLKQTVTPAQPVDLSAASPGVTNPYLKDGESGGKGKKVEKGESAQVKKGEEEGLVGAKSQTVESGATLKQTVLPDQPVPPPAPASAKPSSTGKGREVWEKIINSKKKALKESEEEVEEPSSWEEEEEVPPNRVSGGAQGKPSVNLGSRAKTPGKKILDEGRRGSYTTVEGTLTWKASNFKSLENQRIEREFEQDLIEEEIEDQGNWTEKEWARDQFVKASSDFLRGLTDAFASKREEKNARSVRAARLLRKMRKARASNRTSEVIDFSEAVKSVFRTGEVAILTSIIYGLKVQCPATYSTFENFISVELINGMSLPSIIAFLIVLYYGFEYVTFVYQIVWTHALSRTSPLQAFKIGLPILFVNSFVFTTMHAPHLVAAIQLIQAISPDFVWVDVVMQFVYVQAVISIIGGMVYRSSVSAALFPARGSKSALVQVSVNVGANLAIAGLIAGLPTTQYECREIFGLSVASRQSLWFLLTAGVWALYQAANITIYATMASPLGRITSVLSQSATSNLFLGVLHAPPGTVEWQAIDVLSYKTKSSFHYRNSWFTTAPLTGCYCAFMSALLVATASGRTDKRLNNLNSTAEKHGEKFRGVHISSSAIEVFILQLTASGAISPALLSLPWSANLRGPIEALVSGRYFRGSVDAQISESIRNNTIDELVPLVAVALNRDLRTMFSKPLRQSAAVTDAFYAMCLADLDAGGDLGSLLANKIPRSIRMTHKHSSLILVCSPIYGLTSRDTGGLIAGTPAHSAARSAAVAATLAAGAAGGPAAAIPQNSVTCQATRVFSSGAFNLDVGASSVGAALTVYNRAATTLPGAQRNPADRSISMFINSGLGAELNAAGIVSEEQTHQMINNVGLTPKRALSNRQSNMTPRTFTNGTKYVLVNSDVLDLLFEAHVVPIGGVNAYRARYQTTIDKVTNMVSANFGVAMTNLENFWATGGVLPQEATLEVTSYLLASGVTINPIDQLSASQLGYS